MLTLVLLSVIFILFLVKFVSWRNFNDKLEKFDGPKLHWLLGTAGLYPTLDAIIPAFQKLITTHKGIVRLQNGFYQPKFLMTTDYSLLGKVYSSDKLFPKSARYHAFTNFVGNSLFVAKGKSWHDKRKLLTPAFHFRILEQLVDVNNSASKPLLQRLSIETTKPSTDIHEIIKRYTFDVITETAMGIKFHAQTNKECNYINYVTEILKIISERLYSPYKFNNFLYWFTETYKKDKKLVGLSNEIVDVVIMNRQKELQNRAMEDIDDDGLSTKKRKSFIDILLTNEVPLSIEDLRNEVNTFMAAGYDTTATSLSFALYNLAKNFAIQEKILEEQKAIFGDNLYADVSYSDLNRMTYLEMVVKESLRIIPSVPVVSKVVEQDFDHDGKVIPKGTTILAFIHGVHRDPKIYPDPEKFDPERFSSENKSNRGPYSYIPFSAGARNCIGQKFAMVELKATLSTILRRFIVKEVPGYEPKLYAAITTVSMNGVQIKLEHRIRN